MMPTFRIATAKYERPVEAAEDARKTLTRSGGGGGRSLLSASPQLGAGIIRNNLAIPIGYLAIGGNLDCTSFSLCFA